MEMGSQKMTRVNYRVGNHVQLTEKKVGVAQSFAIAAIQRTSLSIRNLAYASVQSRSNFAMRRVITHFPHSFCIPPSLPQPSCRKSSTKLPLSSASTPISSPPSLTLYYSDHYTHPLPPNHRFPMEKYTLVRQALLAHPLMSTSRFLPAPLATRQQLELAHTSSYVMSFLKGTLSDKHIREIGFPWSIACVRRALGSTGATVAAVRLALHTRSSKLTAHLAGGTHHAHRDGGAGFCVFNDLAVAAMVARREFGVRKICVLDFDVHQGDGTADIFEGDNGVMTVSVHCEGNYPFEKKRSDLDVGLEDWVGDERYLDAVQGVLTEVGNGWELVLLQMGVDSLASDRLGRGSVSREGLSRRNRMVYQWLLEGGANVGIVTMGGGYGKEIGKTVEAHCDVYLDAVRAVAEFEEGRQSNARKMRGER